MFQERIDVIRETLALIERDVKDMRLDIHMRKLAQKDSKPIQLVKKAEQNGKPWSEFEKDLLKEDFNALTDNLSKKFGRTRLSIILHIQTYISEGLR